MLDPTTTVAQIALELPHATRVFESLGIDYCCGGSRTLVQACDEADLSVGDLIARLEREEEARPGRRVTVEDDLTEIIDHILGTHHVFTRAELARLLPLAEKVRKVHGERHPELREVERLLVALDAELGPHLFKEERVLFPYIVSLETRIQGGPVPHAPFGTVKNPVAVMGREHDRAGALLRDMRKAGADYAVPPDACGSYRALYEGLAALEADLHEHIHLENNLLFPRAVDLEARVWGPAPGG